MQICIPILFHPIQSSLVFRRYFAFRFQPCKKQSSFFFILRTTLRSLRISRWQDNTLSSSVISVPSFSVLYSLLRSYTQIYICSHHKNCNNMDIPFLMLYLFQVKLRFHIFYIPVSSIFSPFILGYKKDTKNPFDAFQ